MKTNIKKWPFNINGKESETLFWYSWTEHCDKCGKLIHNNDLHSSKEPDLKEMDYCHDCLRELFSHNKKDVESS